MSSFRNLLKSKETRKKLLVLLGCLGLYKIGMHIYVPGINREVLDFMESNNTGLFSLMNTFTGGALSSFSIFAVGIMPYITASIIVQLLQMDVVSIVTEWKEQGEFGKKKIKRLTYVLTFVFALMQSIMLSMTFNQMYAGLLIDGGFATYALISIVLTLGTIILVVLGEVIERKGIGRGISIIILAGIIMMIPNYVSMFFTAEFTEGNELIFLSIVKIVLLLLFIYTLLFIVIIVNGAERKIPIQYAQNNYSKNVGINTNYLPIKLNIAGVIPVIFASAFFMLPVTLLNIFDSNNFISKYILTYMSFESFIGIALYAALIIGFNYFYSFITMDPMKMADNLHKSQSYIPGIRPGESTVMYLKRLIYRLVFVGSIFLAFVSTVPMLLGKASIIPQQFTMVGTSLIIVVTVSVDLYLAFRVQLQRQSYKKIAGNSTRRMLNRLNVK